jgi:hypothetical protein
VNPPVGADFYPIYTTPRDDHQCSWQLGGTFIPGTRETFGGNSTIEYGPIAASFYPAPNGIPQYILENFHRTLPFNPCPLVAQTTRIHGNPFGNSDDWNPRESPGNWN